jgi:hypothetical protein
MSNSRTGWRAAYLLLFALNLTLVVWGTSCQPSQPATSASAPSRETAVAFASTVGALEVLDVLHAQRMAAMTEPTPEQVAWATAFSDRLHQLRDALAVVRSWLEGQAEDKDGRASFRAAAALLQLLVDDLKSQGIAIPAAVDAGLAAAKYFV